MDCPACGYALRSRKVDQVDLHDCPLCGGLWVATLRSLQLWATFHATREPLPGRAPEGAPSRAEACPTCRRPLASFAYQGSAEVSLQRCDPCGMLFVPGDLQEAARALWAKRAGREAVRLERKADVEAAYRPQRTVVAHGGGSRGGGPRTREGADVGAMADLVFNERARQRAEDPEG